MEVVTKKIKISHLVRDFRGGKLRRPAEYQRGEMWHPHQKQKFVDSLHRGYPVPAIFLHQVKGEETYLDIIDGQQRLAALRDYLDQTHPLRIPDLNGRTKLRLPQGIRDRDVPWVGRSFVELDKEIQLEFMNRELQVQFISSSDSDEIRDLFIRLQAGTPLAPQQIRDAWPGNLSPYIERLAGKFNHAPTASLLGLIDGRGDRIASDDEGDSGRRDEHVVKRQVCAQLLFIFLRRAEELKDIPSIGSKQLDQFYYVYASFPTESQRDLAHAFEKLLHLTGRVVRGALSQLANRKVLPKLEIFSLFMFLQEAKYHYGLEYDDEFLMKLIGFVARYQGDCTGSRTKASTLTDHYEQWLRALRTAISVPETEFINERHAPGYLTDDELDAIKAMI